MYNTIVDSYSMSKEDIRDLEMTATILSSVLKGLKEFTSLRNGIKAVQESLNDLAKALSKSASETSNMANTTKNDSDAKVVNAEATKKAAEAATEDTIAKQSEAAAAVEDASTTQAENTAKTVNAEMTEKEADASTKNALATQGELLATGESIAATELDNVATASNVAITEKGTVATIAHAVAKKALAVASTIASGAIQVFNAVMSSSAGIISVFIGVIAVLVTAFSGIGKKTIEVSEAYKAQVSEVDELIAAQEKLAQSTQDSADSFKDNIARLEANATVAQDVVAEMKDAADNEEKMVALCDKLNATMGGLNLTYDTTDKCIKNVNSGQKVSLDLLEKEITAKAELAKADAWTARYNELLAEQVRLEEDLNLIDERKKSINTDSNLSVSERNDLLAALSDTENALIAQQEENAERLRIVNEELAKSSTATTDEQLMNYERLDAALTSNGENIQQVAEKWGVTSDSIISAMQSQGITLDEWVAKREEAMAAEAAELEAQEAAWSEYQEKVQERIDGTVNSFQKIPQTFEMSGQEMLENLQANKDLYKNWEENMETISAKLGPAAAEHFRKLGPEANSAIEEIIASEDLLAQYATVFDDLTAEAANAGIENLSNPDLAAAPVEALNEGSRQISENTALTDAMDDQMEHMADTVKEKKQLIVDQVKQVVTDAVRALETMVTGAKDATSRMMDGIFAGMDAGAYRVYAKALEIANSVAAIMRRTLQVRSPSRVMIGIFKNVMLGITGGMDAMKDKVYATAAGIADGVSARLTVSPELAGVTNAALLANASRYASAPAVSGLPDDSGLLRRTLALLDQYLPALANMQVVMDTGGTVGRLAPAMDDALGRIARQKERG